jgi:hypothetical protein
MRTRVIAALSVMGVLASCCGACVPPGGSAPRSFISGFESLADFEGMYISPQTASTKHALVSSPVHSGRSAHCGWLTGPATSADKDGPNHRGYPTVQLWRIAGGGFRTPADVSLWVWADVAMTRGEWVSFATLSADASDRWARVVTVNLDPGGWVNVFHVPVQGAHEPLLETHRPFPLRTWVHLQIRIDFDPVRGFIEVRQDGELVARAHVNGGLGKLEQAHFGMYAIPSLTSGKVCNDDLRISTPPAATR